MSFRIIYKNLFEINLLHHFFLDKGEEAYDTMSQEDKEKVELTYDIRELLEITPTPDCRKALSARYCLFKLTPKGILVGIKAKPDELQPDKFNPFAPLDEDLTFRFMIRLKDLNFMNYTALPLQGNRDSLFIFKNYKVNAIARYPSLSAIPPLYDPANIYLPGDMLSDHATNPAKLFTALKKTSSNTSTASDWLTETGNETTPISYANVNDRFPVVSGILNYTMKTENVYPVATISPTNLVLLHWISD